MAMATIPAYFLPGWDATGAETTTLTFGTGAEAVALTLPVLTPAALAAVSHALLQAQKGLARWALGDIIDVLDRLIQRWLDPQYAYRRYAETLLPTITHYSLPMVQHGLDRLLQALRKDALWRVLYAEFGDPFVLDTFRPRPHAGGWSRAYGPRLITHIFSGNVPALPAWSLICALVLKSASLGKSASEEPLFAALFARSLWELCPELGACVAVGWWKGGAVSLEAAAFAQAEAVIAYGSEATTRDIQRRVPVATPCLAYSHKLSFGVIGREALSSPAQARQTAEQAAYGVSVFDQQGCVSPHLLYAERGGAVSPQEFASLLAQGMATVHTTLPRGPLPLEDSTAIRHVRGAYEFRQYNDDTVMLLCSEPGTAWTVIYEDETAFAPSCLNRTIRVHPVDDIADIPARLLPVRAYLQTAGVALAPARRQALAETLGRLGVTRISALDRMPWPGLTWHHDGRCNLLDLVRWTDIEGEPDA